MNEDNFYIKYFCKSLETYMQNYQKQYYGLYVKGSKDKNYKIKRCKSCGSLIKNDAKNRQYCLDCGVLRRLETKRNWWKNNN